MERVICNTNVSYELFTILGLGFWSEQAFESVHADFKVEWSKVKVSSDHPDFLDKMLSCMSRYVARHI